MCFRAIINHFNPKIESYAAVNHISQLSEEQVNTVPFHILYVMSQTFIVFSLFMIYCCDTVPGYMHLVASNLKISGQMCPNLLTTCCVTKCGWCKMGHDPMVSMGKHTKQINVENTYSKVQLLSLRHQQHMPHVQYVEYLFVISVSPDPCVTAWYVVKISVSVLFRFFFWTGVNTNELH